MSADRIQSIPRPIMSARRMSPGADQVSAAKGIILRQQDKEAARKELSPPKAVAGPAQKESTVRPQAAAGIPLDDILTAKQPVGRYGPGALHTLIDALAR
jgi:hypothetical protein